MVSVWFRTIKNALIKDTSTGTWVGYEFSCLFWGSACLYSFQSFLHLGIQLHGYGTSASSFHSVFTLQQTRCCRLSQTVAVNCFNIFQITEKPLDQNVAEWKGQEPLYHLFKVGRLNSKIIEINNWNISYFYFPFVSSYSTSQFQLPLLNFETVAK